MGLQEGGDGLLLPPHERKPPARITRNATIPSIVRHLRRRAGMPKRSRQASVLPPAMYQGAPGRLPPKEPGSAMALHVVAAVVYTVSVDVCAAPLIVTEAGMLHVAGSLAASGVMAQLRLTGPVNPPDGVTVIVELFPLVTPGATETVVPVMVKVGVAGRLTVKVCATIVAAA